MAGNWDETHVEFLANARPPAIVGINGFMGPGQEELTGEVWVEAGSLKDYVVYCGVAPWGERMNEVSGGKGVRDLFGCRVVHAACCVRYAGCCARCGVCLQWKPSDMQ